MATSDDGRLQGLTAANVAQNLSGIDFPANRDDLVQHAQDNSADQAVVDALQEMPEREYRTMADVEKGFGEIR